ncbi:TetM/TetW/TetO/TetS family tetracycline resistance ribosomal protection protein [Micromonospora soli]|uniref:elongation factor G n=1 Tax=Micromonospora sp. NBRC 110009 TaxID=3061627 RepID=UPI002672FBA5|nr:TetM/TetW/TetO/TetS family tetracycline resistance ribosomal protection protein [Micromonospora sp. NBRC 110009]WKT98176.1 TetM/TetW/TetO/TetS family tetracycline resistance ribosomal protection protein [Micromonospora sp. NBRC 110009]
MKTLNLGILAHVDAGKTSLTERLLHSAGVIDELGSVDHGSTRTDTMALERQRGITIRSAVVSFAVAGITLNLIDTPGHPDFIAEVERALSVLDGAVLVVSAVEGVQAQTRVLARTLQRLGIPTLIFVNKVDRVGADPDRVLRQIADRLSPDVIALGRVEAAGTPAARWRPFLPDDPGHATRLVDLLTAHDDTLLAAYVQDERSLTGARLRAALAAQTARARVHPVHAGSAITGAGADDLITAITELLPAAEGDDDAPLSGTVFKVERGPAGEKIAYARIHAGSVRVRDRIRYRGDHEAKVTAIDVFDGGDAGPSDSVGAGRITRLHGLTDVRVGDPLGTPPDRPGARHHFSPPTLETVVEPVRAVDRPALHAALAQLAEQDPLINLRQDDLRREIAVSLYGEVQKEVIQATLADEYGVPVTFRETTTVCVERPVGVGAAVEWIGKDPNPFLGTVGLRIEPAPIDSGVEFRLGIELGSMPLAFLKAIEETVRDTLRQGLHGWEVVDCVVTLTHGGYWARQSHAHGVFDKSMSSTAGDFRNLTPLVLMAALGQAGTRVHEPLHRFRLDLPADLLGTVLPVLATLDAVPGTATLRGGSYLLDGEVPAGRVHALEQRLPSLTRGEGTLESEFDHYRPVRGPVPTRPRWDHDPLHRKEYLLAVARRVSPRPG